MDSLVQWITQRGAFELEEIEFSLCRGPGRITFDRHAFFQTAKQMRNTLVNKRADTIDIGPHIPGGNENLARSMVVFDLDVDDYDCVFPEENHSGELDENTGVIRPIAWALVSMSARLLDCFLEHFVYEKTDESATASWSEHRDANDDGDIIMRDVVNDSRGSKRNPLDVSGGSDVDEKANASQALSASKQRLAYRSLAVFSGRRGVHLWIMDKYRDEFNEDDVKELVDRIGGLQKALGACELFEKITQLAATDLTWYPFMDQVELYAREALVSEHLWERNSTSRELCDELSAMLGQEAAPSADFFRGLQESEENEEVRSASTSFWRAAGILLLAPRLDTNVILGKNHLAKAPFSVHPVTGAISLPIDLARIETFRSLNHIMVSVDDLYHADTAHRDAALSRFTTAVNLFERITAS